MLCKDLSIVNSGVVNRFMIFFCDFKAIHFNEIYPVAYSLKAKTVALWKFGSLCILMMFAASFHFEDAGYNIEAKEPQLVF